MKKIALLTLVLGWTSLSFAQVKMADLSPRSTVNQKVGLTDFTVDYSRPSVRDRKIFGDVTPYGKVWRTGANMSSTVEFSSEITFGGATVEAGVYSVYAKPDADKWTIYLYDEIGISGTPEVWSTEKIVAEVSVPVAKQATKQETFSISFENITTTSADLRFSWENTTVDVPVIVPSKALSMESIQKTMAGPSDRDYYNAASFYFQEKIELEKAREYITKAVEMRGPEAFWYTRKKALIEFELGDVAAAIASAEMSLESAKTAEYASYIKMNEESLEEWRKMPVSKSSSKKKKK